MLRLALVRPATFDPAAQRLTSSSAMIAMDLLLDGLTSIDVDSGRAVPELAASWQVSDDGLRWRFDLDRAGDDGRPLVTAADVKWTLDRIAAVGDQSISGSSLASVVGYDELAAGGETVGLAGVEVVRPDRLVIRLSEPFAALPALLAHPTFGILPEGGEEALPEAPGAWSSSRFVVDEMTDDRLVLDATDRFEGVVDGVEIRWVDDEAEAAALVTDGAVDLAPAGAGLVGVGEQEIVGPAASTVFFGMNLADGALADPALRRAIVQAVNREGLSADLFGDAAIAVAGLIPEPGRDVCGDNCTFDPDVSTQLLEFVFGDEEPPTIRIDFVEGDDREQALAEGLAVSLRVVGIPAELAPATVTELEDRIAAGEHQLFRFGWVSGYADEQSWLDSLFRSDGPDNVFNLVDDGIDEMLDELARTEAPPERRERAETLEREILGTYVVLPLLARQHVMAASADVDGVILRSDGTFDVELVAVD
ncbi:MAG: ABC transporter substrate-binding protein [Acidimicrobiia bacterium]|nr:ABC transporter substrate-binding protein [Acidimicrobiia bacterium]